MDWGNGAPAPDETAAYPLTAAMGPNNVTDARAHTFTRACLYDVTFRSVDDDGAASEDHASILVTETGHQGRLDGYWQHQLRRNGGNLLDDSVINCYLAIVDRVSSIFGEMRSVSTVDAAFDLVNLRQNGGSELEKLDRALLVAWFNFASGAVGYAEAVDTNKDGIGAGAVYGFHRRRGVPRRA